MSFRWRLVARLVVLFAIVLGASGAAHAVAAFGTVKRVDVDPIGTPIYWIGNFYVARTAPGGFAIAWEENTKSESPNPIVYERIPFRIYNNAFAPVAVPKPANLSGRSAPNLARLVPLSANNAYLVYYGTRSNANPDHSTLRDAFGQTIALSTGAATGARQLLNSTGNWDTLIALASSLSGGGAVAAWYESDAAAPVSGRLINGAGTPQPTFLNFACCAGAAGAKLTGLYPEGTGFVASYLRNSIFGGNNGLYGRVFNANGQPVSAAKFITANTTNPFVRTLSNNRIAVFAFQPLASPANHFKLVVQLYDQNWATIGLAKTLIPDVTSTQFLEIAPTLDGGVFMAATTLNGSVYTRSVRRLNAAFNTVAPDFTLPTTNYDYFRVATLNAHRAVVLYRNIVGGRHRLFAQVVSY
jgi:hypothetical protein